MGTLRKQVFNLLERIILEHRLRGLKTFLTIAFTFWAVDLVMYGLRLHSPLTLVLLLQAAALGALALLNCVQAIVEERLSGRRAHLLNSFPAQLKDAISRGEEALPENLNFVRAVVGFVRLDSETSKLRRGLYELTSECTIEHGFVVLKQTSEGIVFLANYFENSNWPLNLVTYFENLLIRIEKLPGTHAKIGVSMGPLNVQLHAEAFSATGPEIELATELCQRAKDGQMLMTSKIWHSLSDSLRGWNVTQGMQTIPGLTQEIPTMVLDRRLDAPYRRHCWSCGSDVQILQSAEGYIRVVCEHSHIQPNLDLISDESSNLVDHSRAS